MKRWLRIIGLVGMGLAAGILLGLYLGWIAWPTEFTDANPSVLAAPYKQEYLLMVATIYTADGNLPAAQQRLMMLGQDGRTFLNDYVLDQILRGERGDDTRRLAQLAYDLGLDSPALQPFLSPLPEPGEP
ncbi:MAG: hypothetical protein IPM39_14685 [Chloroflexi bacterium]|nr:hypothetical protein [Chloroflexota bacterium]